MGLGQTTVGMGQATIMGQATMCVVLGQATRTRNTSAGQATATVGQATTGIITVVGEASRFVGQATTRTMLGQATRANVASVDRFATPGCAEIV